MPRSSCAGGGASLQSQVMIYGTCEPSDSGGPNFSKHPVHLKFISYNTLIYVLDFFFSIFVKAFNKYNKRLKVELQV